MSRISRGTPEGDAYLDLQQQARKSGRPTDEMLLLYVLEGFLARLAASAHREKFVLKGGVLLAAFGNRRPTRDVDLAGLALNNDAEVILALVRDILAVRLPDDDGIEFDPTRPRPRSSAKTTNTPVCGSAQTRDSRVLGLVSTWISMSAIRSGPSR